MKRMKYVYLDRGEHGVCFAHDAHDDRTLLDGL
jgi:hypothetical protein